MTVVISLAGVFSKTRNRREAAQKVLRVLFPFGVLAIAAEGVKQYMIKG